MNSAGNVDEEDMKMLRQIVALYGHAPAELNRKRDFHPVASLM
jgi:hypothetical protein